MKITSKQELAFALQVMCGGDSRMTPKQFKDAIAFVGLTQRQAGEFFGYSARTGQSWALGTVAVPLAVAECLEWMVAHTDECDFE